MVRVEKHGGERAILAAVVVAVGSNKYYNLYTHLCLHVTTTLAFASLKKETAIAFCKVSLSRCRSRRDAQLIICNLYSLFPRM
jgi:hypothetical protein